MLKITIDNEEVLCDKDFTINEEMLNTSSTILNNVYPVEWEEDKDYVSRFYYPKDYSKCKIFDEIYHPETKEEVEGTSFSIEVDKTKEEELLSIKGQTTQDGTPTPTSPQPINITTGRQEVKVNGKNLLPNNATTQTINNITYTINEDKTIKVNGTANGRADLYLYGSSSDNGEYLYIPKGNYTLNIQNITNGTMFYAFREKTAGTRYQTNTNNGLIELLAQQDCYFYGVMLAVESGRTITNMLIYPQLEKGQTPSQYEEYKGTDYEINLGKNLFYINDCTLTNGGTVSVSNGNTITITGTFSTGTNFSFDSYVNFTNANTQLGNAMTLSVQNIVNQGTTSITPNRLFLGSVDTLLYMQPNQTTGIITKTLEETLTRCRLYVPAGTYNTTFNVQLEKGSASSFSPYKTPIYLGKIGTYQDYIFRNTTENPLYDSNLEEGQWYIHKEIGRDTITGSGAWSFINGALQTQGVRPSDIQDISSSTMAYCNYFKYHYYPAGITSNMQNGEFGWNSSKKFTIKNTSLTSYNDYVTWLSTHPLEVYYILNTPTNTLIEDEELINQLNAIQLISGLNNIIVSSANLPGIIKFLYNYAPEYTEEDLYFCGIVKNTGEISLNPRYPHYCNLQVLDFKDFLSQGETLDFVITDKTIGEAIDQVIGTIAPYGFIKGNILLDDIDDAMGTYSTKDKTAYDVFNYIADITQSRWTTRMIDENTIAIDFYDPNKLPMGTAIDYTNEWFCTHKINDINYSYSSNDYRNKQVMLSGEVYSNIETTEILVADGYQTQFNTIDKIGKVSSLLLNGTPVSIITKDEYDLGYDADFYYQPGNKYFESVNLVSTGAILTIVYYAIIEGREVILNQDEISRVENMTGRKGVIARYENRNDATTTGELQAIGQSYLEYKGTPEIKLNITSRENTWNIGDRVYFNAPLDELKQTYMVKSKKIQRIATIDEMFYQYELTSSFNMEQDINYFDNQRFKSKGNIGEGEFISRNVDIENTANVIFYNLDVEEVEIEGNSTLQAELQAPLGVE